jgi:hypothetical protein
MKVVAALVPFVGMFIVFVVVLRAIVFSDRREREAMKRLEEADASRAGATTATAREGAVADLAKKGPGPEKAADM